MTRLRLLLIEDSEDDAALLVRELARAGYDVTSERVDTPEGLAAALERQRWDIAIADYTMPRFSGTAALTLLRKHDAEMPFIFVSGTIGEDVAVGAMRTGAHDYIMKGSLKRLVPAVERELREAESRFSRKRAEARLVHLAYHDTLTDLPNRVLLHDRLGYALLAAERASEPLGLLILDLDGFKAINDSLGHQAGDRVLQELAARLRALLRDGDTVARLGGDEFAFVLPRTDGDGAARAAREVLRAVDRSLVLDGRPLELRGSVGIAWCPEHGSDADVLLQKADIAMYVAKSGGLGYACYAPDRDRHAHRRLTLMTELRDGIARGQFSFDYQPIVSLQSGTVWSVEALARWDHPRQGRLPPAEFIGLAEQTGLIEPLTLVLLDKALAEWSGRDGGPSIPVAVNLSPRSLRDPGFPDQVADLLRRRQRLASALVFEITENLILSDTTRSMTCLSRLHEMGVKLAIDDYGIGYSSLSYLRRLPVDRLKIDRSFVSGLAAGDDAIVRSTIDLAHNLGLTVVAEGVESAEARDRLQELGCDAAQGNFIAKPGSATDIRRWVARQDAPDRP
ncbi:MAG TPA: EAL domain-containing protein [Vicinamibacterales bacterium]|jgi:diguanylate cyclase (GGDEF)-like protein|nr:EAL domain-containing protein [Vicinamibacterales bacterium]